MRENYNTDAQKALNTGSQSQSGSHAALLQDVARVKSSLLILESLQKFLKKSFKTAFL